MKKFIVFKRPFVLLLVVAVSSLLIGPSANAQAPTNNGVTVASPAHTQTTLGTSIPYQGQLKDNGAVANGAYDFQFKLFDDAIAGNQVGSDLNQNSVTVANGLFSVALDFGSGVFNGEARYLEIGVRPGASTDAYTTLSPRRPLLAVPYALYSLGSAGSGSNLAYGAMVGAPANSVYANSTGQIGIGTTTPVAKLDVVNSTDVTVARFGVLGGDARLGIASDGLASLSFISQAGKLAGPGTEGGVNAIMYDRPNHLLSLRTGSNIGYPRLSLLGDSKTLTRIGIPSDGVASISFISQGGLLDGNGVEAGINALVYDRPNKLLSLNTGISGTHPRLVIDQNGYVGIGTTTPTAQLDVAGTMRASIIQITGGDLAEPFEIAGAETIQPGMVVAIDPDNPGQMRLTNTAYDHTVAGVISGAGGIHAGVLMYKDGATPTSHPVALTGRVYVYADASNGAIAPGDLLTTAAMPGHAMKVTDHERAQGAILGKAMSKLAKGTGLVLVLVTLQ